MTLITQRQLEASAHPATASPLMTSVGGDLYASWQAVFERVQVLEVPRDAQPDVASGHRARSHPEDALRYAPAHASDANGGVSVAVGAPGLAGIPIVPAGEDGAENGVANPIFAGLSSSSMQRAAPHVPQTLVAALPHAVHTARSARHSAVHEPPAPPRTLTPERSQPMAQESVRVFVHDATVTLVVRDAALAGDAALDAAFATASELTGRGNSLRRLTLNGRTLYHQDTQTQGTRAAPAFVFAC